MTCDIKVDTRRVVRPTVTRRLYYLITALFKSSYALLIDSSFSVFVSDSNSGLENKIAILNQTVVLRCRCDLDVSWKFIALGTYKDLSIYRNGALVANDKRNVFVNITNLNQSNLFIIEAKATNAGTYTCATGGDIYQAQLAVIGNNILRICKIGIPW